ncbi:MAG: tetratricopeptide repeat protein [Prochloraceae cyanobacterium]
MKVSQGKRSFWLYLVLLLMVVALLGFSIIPLVSSFIRENQSQTETASAPISTPSQQEEQEQLELEAKGYQLVLQKEPDNQTALRELVKVRLKQGDLQNTIEPLEKLVKLNPELTDYGILLAQAKQQLGDYEGAAAAYRTILATNTGNILALQGIVNLLLNQELPEKAIVLLQDSLKNAEEANLAQPDAVDVASIQLLLAQVYAEQKRYQEAINIYDRAMEADEKDMRPVLSKALVLQEQGKEEEAQPLFSQAADLAPEYKDQIEALASQTKPIEPTKPEAQETEDTNQQQSDAKPPTDD